MIDLMVVLVGLGSAIGGFYAQGIKKPNNKFMSKELCEERHGNLLTNLTRIEKKIDKVLENGSKKEN